MKLHLASAGTAALLLAASAPGPGAALHTLWTAGSAADVAAPLVALTALAAWLLLGWLVGVAALSVAARVPGVAGRAADALAQRVAPAAVRHIVEASLGLTVAVGVMSATPALASAATPAVPPAPPAAASLDWPTPPDSLDWNPTAPAARPAPAAEPTTQRTPSPRPAALAPAVVVQPGDSLWAVAADHLPADATEAQIAAAWPTWWAANRDAVGADPDVISPGLRLIPPVQS